MSDKGVEALQAVHGQNYRVGSMIQVSEKHVFNLFKVGSITGMLYKASGNSLDWAHGEVGISFAISMELRDTGRYGFLLPPSQIIQTAEETWAFHMTVIRELIKGEKNIFNILCHSQK